MLSNDKMVHTAQLAMLLITATILIVYGHQYIAPEIVFSSMIAGLAGIVGSRIAANGYVTAPHEAASPTPTPTAAPLLDMQAPLPVDSPTAKMQAVTAAQPAIKKVPVVRLPATVDRGG